MKYNLITLICLLSLGASAAHAATLKGEFSFEKKPPKFAVVYFSDDTSGAAGSVEVGQKDKQFDKNIVIAPKGSTVVFKNNDSVAHNIFADDKSTGVAFDSGLLDPNNDANQAIEWDDGKVVRVGCKIHPKMSIYVGSINSNHYKVIEFQKTDKTLAFEIPDVPDNLKAVKIWIARYDELTAEVPPGGSASIDVTRKGKPKGKLTLSR